MRNEYNDRFVIEQLKKQTDGLRVIGEYLKRIAEALEKDSDDLK